MKTTTLRIRAAAGACALFLLAGCGSSAGADAADDSSSGDGAYPVTVSTTTGKTTIEKKPERIVTLGNPAFEDVIALGSDPVGASVTGIDGLPYLEDHAEDKAIDDKLADVYSGEVDYEAIANLNPDLIVAPAWPQFVKDEVVDKLNEIAPTLVFDMQTADKDWRTGLNQVAQALDTEDKAEKLVDDTVESYKEVGDKHPELADRPYSFGLFYESTISLATAGTLLHLFGLEPAADQAKAEEGSEQVTYSLETADKVGGELVLLMPSPADAADELESAPAWKGDLEDRVVWLTAAQGEAINNSGILGKAWLPAEIDKSFSDLK